MVRMRDTEEWKRLKDLANGIYGSAIHGQNDYLYLLSKLMYRAINRIADYEAEDLSEEHPAFAELEDLRLKIYRMHQDYGTPTLELIELEYEDCLEDIKKLIQREKARVAGIVGEIEKIGVRSI
jgi:hypothetical protein